MKTGRKPAIASNHRTAHSNIRTGLAADDIAQALIQNLRCLQARTPQHATRHDWYTALAYTVRDRLLDRTLTTVEAVTDTSPDTKIVAYLSAEFLTGPHLANSLVNLGIWDAVRAALDTVGQDLTAIIEQEEEPGLGNGGLGRLAACYMDSLVDPEPARHRLRHPLRVRHLRPGDPRRLAGRADRQVAALRQPVGDRAPGVTFDVKFGGRTEPYVDAAGPLPRALASREDGQGRGLRHPGARLRVPTTNLLRLWKAEATESFDFDAFNVGDYYGAVEQKMASETISKVLYPNDEPEAGKRLRLAQQYFFVSCSLQDMVRLLLMRGKELDAFDSLLGRAVERHASVDRRRRADAAARRRAPDGLGSRVGRSRSGPAATPTTRSFPRRWRSGRSPLFGALLPRHLEIVCEINRRFLDEVRQRYPDDDRLPARVADRRNGGPPVRMAHLACVGSHAINGVAALHSDLLKQTVLADFYRSMPEKFRNVTNGVTPRRWIALSNPPI